jgi:hypothetical protein
MHSARTQLANTFSRASILVAALVLRALVSGQCQGQDILAVSVTLQNPTVTLHEPVVANLFVHNGGAEETRVDLGYDREGALEFSIVQPDGSTVKVPRLRRHEGISRLPELSLQPGEAYYQELLLNKWYMFSKPGSYRILMRLATTIRSGTGVPEKAEFSQELALQVDARDEKRLERACEKLAAAATSASTETALDAARALSYVEDLVAVPYLARLTKEGSFKVYTRNIALEGLGRIARSEGLDAVISRLSPADSKWEPEISAEARK